MATLSVQGIGRDSDPGQAVGIQRREARTFVGLARNSQLGDDPAATGHRGQEAGGGCMAVSGAVAGLAAHGQ
ncbi:hypothetical protein [Streptomyces violascens]|uniref:hypothetical protein n=1 Tax=Streptomyces violascens TaxID=67381 RepID=UPI00368B2FBF